MKTSGEKLNVAVICGGNSGEFDISIQSGNVVVAMLNKQKYHPYLIVIKGKDWNYMDTEGKIYPINKDDFSLQLTEGKVHFDVVFNAIHGTPGEDGKLLGYFEMLGIECTSSNYVVSAATFNKNYCKQLVQSTGVGLAPGLFFRKTDKINNQYVIDTLGLPVFVKPNSSGSSVGVSKVKEVGELTAAIEKAFREDDEILIETFIKGREMGCGVFEYKGRMIVFPVTEIISKKEFFDYEAKYTKGMSDEITPADIDAESDMEIKATSAMLYKHIGCKGFVRFDFIITQDDLYFLEVNTVPGMTSASILPQQAEAMGIRLEDLFDMAVENAFFKDSKGS